MFGFGQSNNHKATSVVFYNKVTGNSRTYTHVTVPKIGDYIRSVVGEGRVVDITHRPQANETTVYFTSARIRKGRKFKA